MITEIMTHIADAQARLITQYKSKSKIKSLVEAFVQEFQNIETVVKDLNEDRSIDTAVGAVLDRLGSVVGQTREPGQSDDDYRIAIKAKVGQNISQGEPERLIETFRLLKGVTEVLLTEHWPAGVGFSSYATYTDQNEINMLAAILEKTAAACIRIEHFVIYDETESFKMAGVKGGLGFGTTSNPLAGGKFATVRLPLKEFAFAGNDPKPGGFGTIYDTLVGGSFVT